MFVIARYSMMELIRGRMFLIILCLALLVNFLMSYGFYKAANKWGLVNEIEQEMRFQPEMTTNPLSSDFDLSDVDVPLMIVKNIMRWLVYVMYIFFGNFLAIFGAVGLIGPELDKRIIYTLISKPLSRTHIFLGKLLGLLGMVLFYAIVMNVAAQIFFLAAGAGFHFSLLLTSAVGFLNFMIFGILAILLSTRLNLILATVLSVLILWSSTNFSTTMINAVGKSLFKFGSSVDLLIMLLPSQKSIGNYAIHFLFDKYWTGMVSQMPPEIFELITDKSSVLIQPLIWLGAVLVLSYLSFFRKEFD